jgi:AraC-like DNA-binding protein
VKARTDFSRPMGLLELFIRCAATSETCVRTLKSIAASYQKTPALADQKSSPQNDLPSLPQITLGCQRCPFRNSSGIHLQVTNIRRSYNEGLNLKSLQYYESLRKVAAYISSHYDDAISLNSLSSACGMEAKYLSRLFHVKSGVKVTDYIALVRLRAALSIMQQRDAPMLDIAMLTGFGSIRTFERACRKHLGQSPNALRKRLRPNQAPDRPTNLIPTHLKVFFLETQMEDSFSDAKE